MCSFRIGNGGDKPDYSVNGSTTGSYTQLGKKISSTDIRNAMKELGASSNQAKLESDLQNGNPKFRATGLELYDDKSQEQIMELTIKFRDELRKSSQALKKLEADVQNGKLKFFNRAHLETLQKYLEGPLELDGTLKPGYTYNSKTGEWKAPIETDKPEGFIRGIRIPYVPDCKMQPLPYDIGNDYEPVFEMKDGKLVQIGTKKKDPSKYMEPC